MENKSNKFFLPIALMVFVITSCYQDDSTLKQREISDVTITLDGDNDKEELFVSYLDTLRIAPTANRGLASDTVGLEYKWEITETASDQADWVEIGRQPHLNAIMNNMIATTPYFLRYSVTDLKNGNLQYDRLWKVYIKSAFLDGIVVSDTKDNVTSDLSLIMGKQFTLNYTKKDDVIYNIYEKANGKPFEALMTQLTYNLYGRYFSSHTNQLWATTKDGDCVIFDTQDFSNLGKISTGEVLTYKPDGLKCINTFMAAQSLYMNTSKYLYTVNTTSARSFGWHDPDGSNYKIDNGIVAANTFYNNFYQSVVWYDAEKGCFVYSNSGITITYGTDFKANEYFDPTNMHGYTAVAGGMTTDAMTPAMVLKNKATGAYSIFTFSCYKPSQGYWNDDYTKYTETAPEVPQSAKMRYDITGEGKDLMDKAVSVFFANRQSILYIATPDGIYSVNFSGMNPILSKSPHFVPANGEKITKAKLYLQGHYMVEADNVGKQNNPDLLFDELPLNGKAVVVSTQDNENKGKITILPMIQLGTGNLDAGNAKSFGGFNKIIDFCTTGY